jgi:Fur family peroxide stress response transcriptional regulator
MEKDLINRLKKKGIVLTPQRIAVMEILKNYGHLTPEETYKIMKEKFPTISFATVYNILEKFVELGEIQKLNIKKDRACFDKNPSFHHHFYCQICEKIIDIDNIECPVFKKREIKGNKVKEVQAYFYGICKECLGKEKK